MLRRMAWIVCVCALFVLGGSGCGCCSALTNGHDRMRSGQERTHPLIASTARASSFAPTSQARAAPIEFYPLFSPTCILKTNLGASAGEPKRSVTKGCLDTVMLEGFLRARYAGFRAACAVINRGFGAWDKLIVLERILTGPAGVGDVGKYQFVVLGVNGDHVSGFRSVATDNGNVVALSLTKAKGSALLEAISAAEKTLPPAMMYEAAYVDGWQHTLYVFCPDTQGWRACVYAREADECLVYGSRDVVPCKLADLVRVRGFLWREDEFGDGDWANEVVANKTEFLRLARPYIEVISAVQRAAGVSPVK